MGHFLSIYYYNNENSSRYFNRMSLVAHKLFVSLADVSLLENASITCEAGKITALCGPNGAGKSTLLNVLAGQCAYQKGTVQINNRCLSQYSSQSLAMVRAVMPQAIELKFPFTARQVIEMGLLFTQDIHESDRIIHQVSKLLSLSTLLDKAYPKCSGGEKQRVQLARVIAQLLQSTSESACEEDKYLLLDESTSAMDLAMMHYAFAALKDIVKTRIGVIAVIHDLNLASCYADDIVFISNKTTSHVGKPCEVITRDNVADVFSARVTVLPHPSLHHPVVLYGDAREDAATTWG